MLLVILGGGVFAYENQAGVVPLLRSQKRGRMPIFQRKTAICMAMAAVVWAAVYLREFIIFINFFGTKTLSAPIRNFTDLAHFPLKIALWQYLAALYAARLIMLAAGSVLVLALSRFSGTVLRAYALNFAVLGMPALLALFGAEALKYISPLVTISSAEIFWSMGSGSISGGFLWLIRLSISAAACALSGRRWKNN